MTDVSKILVGGISYPIKAPSVEDYGRNGDNLRFWTGTLLDYNTIVDNHEIDPATLYMLTDVHEVYLGSAFVANYSRKRDIGEIVTSTIPLVDSGVHLTDGSLFQSGGIYNDFVQYMAKVYENAPISGYHNWVTAVGSPIITDGVVSGFSTANYVKSIPTLPASTADTWQFHTKVYFTSFGTANATFIGDSSFSTGLAINTTPAGQLVLYLGNSGWNISNGTLSTETVALDTWYYVRVTFDGTQYLLDVSIDDSDWTNYVTVISAVKASCAQTVLGAWNTTFMQGSIDLRETYTRVNGARYWIGSTPNKRGFCTEEEWQESITNYGVCGKYVYNEENGTVRIPKIMGITRNAIGEDNVGTYAGFMTPASSGTFAITNVLCYIVISEGFKTNVEVNIDNVVTTINRKVDKSDLREIQCIVEEYKNGTSWYRIYSNGWCEQGGRIYIANNATVTVSLLKAYTDTTYTILHSTYTTNQWDVWGYGDRVISVSNTLFTMYRNNSTSGYLSWRTEGYIL